MMIRLKIKNFKRDINREAAKKSVLSSGRIDNYEYLTGGEILPSNQKQIIEQAAFPYSPLEKDFEKQTKTIEVQGEKQVDALKSLESSDKQLPSEKDFTLKERQNFEILNEIKKIKEEQKIEMIYVKFFTKDIIKHMILQNLKQYVFLLIISEIILLI